jgi:hypothetical protein
LKWTLIAWNEYVKCIPSNIYADEEIIETLETVLHEEKTGWVQCCMRSKWLRNSAT